MKLKSVQNISCSRVNYDPDMPPHQRTNCNIAREVILHGLAKQPARQCHPPTEYFYNISLVETLNCSLQT